VYGETRRWGGERSKRPGSLWVVGTKKPDSHASGKLVNSSKLRALTLFGKL